MRTFWTGTVLTCVALVACGGEDSQFLGETPDDDEPGSSSGGPGSIDGPGSDASTPPPTDGGVIDCDADPAACLPPGVCGDSQPGLGESCDDGNVTAGDGCSPTCQVEGPYWACEFGKACIDARDCAALLDAGLADPDGGCELPVQAPVCGDGQRADSEACDDGNVVGGDGCSADCFAVEADFVCPTPGALCVTTVVCGDGRITGSEQCDDGNAIASDGCSATCQIETGWACAIPGVECTAAECGDGLVAGDEECDDRNDAAYGCDGTCRLQTKTVVTDPAGSSQGGTVIEHYKCVYPDPALNPLRQVCTRTTCGDNQREGTEQCDDGNTRPYDGCSPNCEVEADCRAGECKSKCGDGRLFDFDTPADVDNLPDEECDDGNLRDGDGCSSTCRIEAGYSCSVQSEAQPNKLDVPIIVRDFNHRNETAAGYTPHPDFQKDPAVSSGAVIYFCNAVTTGIVKSSLNNGMPEYLDGDREGSTNGTCGGSPCCSDRQLKDATSFADWYTDNARARPIYTRSLRLNRVGGSYVFDSATDAPYTSLSGFYPIAGLGWHDPAPPAPNAGAPANASSKNGGFTTEFRYAFTYDAQIAGGATPPKLDFSGDDDVWVFINGTLALDIGGMHDIKTGSFTLNTAKAATLALEDKHVYEIALFHAEREESASNFKLTMRGFTKRTSVCSSVCGDNVKTRNEQCDLGDQNANPAPYGGCSTTCQLGAYCGDSTTQNPPEVCDDGTNATVYTTNQSSTACGPGCARPDYCGDGEVQGAYGERCDRGDANTSDPNAYNNCLTTCRPGPRCGDGQLQANHGEQCDDGFNVQAYVAHPTGNECAPQCKKPRSCGDGTLDYPFEQCDNGGANSNTGAYGSCTTECKLGPRCGDGVINGSEQCDDGNRVNGDGCSAACLKESSGPH